MGDASRTGTAKASRIGNKGVRVVISEQEAVAIASSNFNKQFVRITNGEYRSTSGCPWCGDGGKGTNSDRFRLITNGGSGPRVWCRKCDNFKFLDALDRVEQIDKRLAAVEIKQRELEQRQKEYDERLKNLEVMHKTTDHIQYYNNMGDHLEAINYWTSEGMTPQTINERYLGYCPKCPTAPFTDSMTIPVLYRNLPWNIRHRLLNTNGSGKYRPHMAGLPTMLFNADDLHRAEDYILILEGEKKSIIVSQETQLPNVAIMGKVAFNPSWAEKFERYNTVYVALDPDADDRAVGIAKLFKGRGKVVSLPLKADDFFVLASGKPSDFKDYIQWARKI